MTDITLPPGVTGVPESIAEAVREYKYSAVDLAMLRDDDVALLVADPANRRAVVEVKVWHRKLREALKVDTKTGESLSAQIISEIRNTGPKDAFGRLRNGKAYTNGVSPKNAYESSLCSRVGIINLPREIKAENYVHLCEPRLWTLDREWKTADYVRAFKEWIAVGENGADAGLLKFWGHRRKAMELLVKVYSKFTLALPQTEKEAEDVSEMMSDVIELMQYEIMTITKKLKSMGRAEVEDNGKQLLPFWLADVLAKEKDSIPIQAQTTTPASPTRIAKADIPHSAECAAEITSFPLEARPMVHGGRTWRSGCMRPRWRQPRSWQPRTKW